MNHVILTPESHAGRLARRVGLILRKARSGPQAGTYGLYDRRSNCLALGDERGYGYSLDVIVEHLSDMRS